MTTDTAMNKPARPAKGGGKARATGAKSKGRKVARTQPASLNDMVVRYTGAEIAESLRHQAANLEARANQLKETRPSLELYDLASRALIVSEMLEDRNDAEVGDTDGLDVVAPAPTAEPPFTDEQILSWLRDQRHNVSGVYREQLTVAGQIEIFNARASQLRALADRYVPDDVYWLHQGQLYSYGLIQNQPIETASGGSITPYDAARDGYL